MNFTRRIFSQALASSLGAIAMGSLLTVPSLATAADLGPDAFIGQLSTDLLTTIRNDKANLAGDVGKIGALVDAKLMPHVNFKRMTASAVGPAWSKSSPEQQKQLQDEFKTLLIRIYAGAVAQINDQTISVKPTRFSAEDPELVVKTEVRGAGDPIQLDYRIEKTPGQGLGWKIYNFNVMGVWMMETYRGQFSKEINANGVDGLIQALAQRNKLTAKK